MAQDLQLLAETRESSSKKETCKGTSSSVGYWALASDCGKSKSYCQPHSCDSLWPQRDIHSSTCHSPPRLFLAEVPGDIHSFPTVTCAFSCCTITSTQPGWGKPRFTSTCSDWRGILKPLAFKERLELLSRVSRAKSFDHSFPVGPGVNCL